MQTGILPKEGAMNAVSGAASAASQVEGVLKDTTSAQIVSKTLDKMNTSTSLTGPVVDSGYQFRKDVLSAAGIGQTLNAVV